MQVGGHVIDVHVKNGVVMRLVAERSDVASNAARLRSDHSRGSHVRDFPIKELRRVSARLWGLV